MDISEIIIPMLEVDDNLKVINCNSSFEKQLKLTAFEIKGKGIEVVNSALPEIVFNNNREIIFFNNDGKDKKFFNVMVDKKNDRYYIYFYDVSNFKIDEMAFYKSYQINNLQKITELISLEYNNQLAAILGFVSFLKNIVNPSNEILQYLNIIEKSAHRASSLTNQLLSFSGSDYFRQTYINLNRVIQQNVELFKSASSPFIDYELQLYNGDLYISWDENQIHQIIINTILNAREAIENKKGKGKITIKTQKSDGFIVYIIEDNGIGINQSNISKVFQPFFTTKDINKHSGMGVSIVEGILKNMGGSINITSDQLTRVEIQFPDNNIVIDDLEVVSNRGNGERVLIIDDKEAMRSLASILLEERNYIPYPASDYLKALKILENNKIDIVLLDIMLEKINGRDLFHKIRELYPDIPIILLTGTGDEVMIKELVYKCGAGLIMKPFKNYEFYNAIESKLHSLSKI